MRIAISIGLVFFSSFVFGQLSVSVSTEKDTIDFGDELTIQYKINIPDGVEIEGLDFTSLKQAYNYGFGEMPEEFDSLMDIDIISGGEFGIDDYNLKVSKDKFQDGIPLSGSVRVRVSSAGLMKVPKPGLIHFSGVQELPLQTPHLYVRQFDGMEDINPNWGIIEEKITWRDYLIYIYIYGGVAAFLLSLYFIITYLRKGKKGFNVQKVEIILPAHEIALRDLYELKANELWQKGDTKGYHTELTRIMRQYIEDRYEVQALEMTSNQLRREMKTKEIDEDIIRRFDDILQIADKVKFAKGNTGPELNIKFMEEALQIVEETKEIPSKVEENS